MDGMESFYIDKVGEHSDDDIDEPINDSNEVEKSVLLELPDLDHDLDVKNKKPKKSKFSLSDTYLINNYKNRIDESSDVNEILEKSIIKPGFEKQIALPPPKDSKFAKRERKKQREKTKGKKWFDIPATQVTKEIQNDFQILKMRAALDRTAFYKNKTIRSIPKYFQVGKVLDSPTDFYSGRIVKSQRKKTIVEELLADAECKNYQRKKFKEIMDTNRRKHSMKRNIKKKMDKKNQKNQNKTKK